MPYKVDPAQLFEKTNQAPTRRKFLTAGPARAGLGLLAAASLTTEARAQSNGDTIVSNFNGTPIPGGDWIWFTAVMKVKGTITNGTTIGFTGSIQFTVNGTLYVVPVPSALVTFSSAVSLATTTYCNGQWITMLPLTHLSGNVFLDGAALQVPSSGFPGGINPVTWQGTFFSMTPGITIDWQWAAAVYNTPFFGTDLTQLGVKPVDDNQASGYKNSDHAGTPENFKSLVIGGARGGGGSNFTGSYSGTGSVTPLPANIVSACGGC